MRLKHKVLAISLSVSLILSSISIGIIVSAAADLTISTYVELKAFADAVNGGNSYEGKTVLMAKSISLGGSTTPWTPIGLSSKTEAFTAFKGTFDGGNHIISELYVDDSVNTHEGRGLFGVVVGGTVKNLTVTGQVKGSTNVGGLIGLLNGGTVQNCLNKAEVTGASSYVAGIAGYIGGNATLSGCGNTGAVKGVNYLAGLVGVCGNYTLTLENCYNTGTVTGSAGMGGLVGMKNSTGAMAMANCYNGGNLTASGWSGALVGRQDAAATYANSYFIDGKNKDGTAAWDYAESGSSGSGKRNPAGVAHGGGPVPVLSSAFAADKTPNINGGMPILEWQLWTDVAPDVTISTYERLEEFAKSVNDGNAYENQYVQLAANISLGGDQKPWTAIGTSSKPFKGTFDGGNHIISDLYIDRGAGDYQGFFGYITGATVKNVTVRGTVKGKGNTAGLVGYTNGGAIQNCLSEVAVTSTSQYVGGITGYVGAATIISGCGNTGNVTSTSTGSAYYIGGIAGRVFAVLTLENCYNTGAISGMTGIGGLTGVNQGSANVVSYTNCYNGGAVSHTSSTGYSGALAGNNSKAAYTNCYYKTGTNAAAVNNSQNPDGTSSVAAVAHTQLGSAFAADKTPGINGGMPILAWQADTDTSAPVLPQFKDKTTRAEQLAGYIRGAINSTKSHANPPIPAGQTLLGNPGWMAGASSTGTDWMTLAMGRYGYTGTDGKYHFRYDDGTGYADYLQALKDYIERRYADGEGLLDSRKATEWHRAVVTILALGGDPAGFGTWNGKPINLIADGSYNYVGWQGDPGWQGINGWIWGLISINGKAYDVPSDADFSVRDFITEILKRQLPDGVNGAKYAGWALSDADAASDPDITGMAIQALAPYYNDDTPYTYTIKSTKETVTKTVRQAVDEALNRMSAMQRPDGDFASWGTVNSESTVQIMIALTALGINPAADPRFITSTGKTLLDGILKYQVEGGGFSHIHGGGWNSMGNDQAAYALVSYWRLENGMRALYDYRDDWTKAEKEKIDAAKAAIDALPAPAAANYKTELKSALNLFRQVSASERQYVYNYYKLSDAIKMVGGEAALDTDDRYPTELLITAQPEKNRYTEGEKFSAAGMAVSVKYNTGATEAVANYAYSPTGALTPDNKKIYLTYGVLKAELPVLVDKVMPWQGEGTQEKPFLLGKLNDLIALRDALAVERYDTRGIHFKLTKDINLENVPEWVPIGSSANVTAMFQGFFEGGGHVIWNLNVPTLNNAGFFGTLGSEAVVQNLGVGSGQIGTFYSANMGGIAGSSEGATIRNCWNGANISGSLWVGGILGGIGAGTDETTVTTIENCYNTGTVTASSGGGIVGQVGTNLAGNGNGVVLRNCYNTGEIKGSGSFSNGGIIGNICNTKSGVTHIIENCYNTGTVSGTNKDAIIGKIEAVAEAPAVTNVYTLTGSAAGTAVTEKTAAEMKAPAFAAAMGSAFKADSGGINGGYPVLAWQAGPKEEAPVDIDLAIGTAEELAAFAAAVNGGKNFRWNVITLTADIDLSGYASWTPIGRTAALQFQGIFDGQGHVIKNLNTLNGLFYYAGDDAVIKNTGVAGGNIGRSNLSFCGAFVGWSNGADVYDCWNAAAVTADWSGGIVGTVRSGTSVISGCYNSGTVTGDNIGGILGHLDSAGDVTVTDCYNTGDIVPAGTRMITVGGIVGRMQSNSTPTNGKVINCYNTGAIGKCEDLPESGALAGLASNPAQAGTFQNCYYLEGAGVSALGDDGFGGATPDVANTFAKPAAFLKSSGAVTALGGRFKADYAGTLNGGYALLDWQYAADFAAAEAADAKIAAVGTVTLGSADAIAEARAAYNALSELQRPLVKRLGTLEAAETELAALSLADAKVNAKADLSAYRSPDHYRDAQKTELANAVAAGKAAIDGAETVEAVRAALQNAKNAVGAIKTDAQLAAQELAAAKTAAKAELDAYKNPADYRAAQKARLADAVSAGKKAIDSADSARSVDDAKAAAKAAMDKIKTAARLTELEKKTLVISDNGIRVETTEAVLDAGTVLKVTLVTDGDGAYDAVRGILAKTAGAFVLYDVSLWSGGVRVQPEDGKVKVTIPVPEGFDAGPIAVYHIADDGSREKMEISVKNGLITFETGGFSAFAVVRPADGGDSPGTGDEAPAVLLFSAALLCAAALAIARRKRKNQSGAH